MCLYTQKRFGAAFFQGTISLKHAEDTQALLQDDVIDAGTLLL